jgi:hypothetical protein
MGRFLAEWDLKAKTFMKTKNIFKFSKQTVLKWKCLIPNCRHQNV